MKIYTRKGDKGDTSLIGGKKVQKSHLRIEAYGTIDELIAHIALLYDMVSQADQKDFLLLVQDRLMTCAAILATDCEDCNIKLPELFDSDTLALEEAIDKMESGLPELKSFVLPGGSAASSQCHIARTVCRRAERNIIRLSTELFVPDAVLKYVNRLSDYLFVLARRILRDFDAKDIHWKPRL